MYPKEKLIIQHRVSNSFTENFERRINAKCMEFASGLALCLRVLIIVFRNNYEITEERLGGVSALIFGGPQDKFSVQEV